MKKSKAVCIKQAVDLAINRILEKGADDIFKPPIFSESIESRIIKNHPDLFRDEARRRARKFINVANLEQCNIGITQRGLVVKDRNSFRQVAWLDPFDAVKYLSLAILLFERIEHKRIPKNESVPHSHRISENTEDTFDPNFGYDSFRARSSELSRERMGKWKVVTDISNFFDRIGIHSLDNHLKDIGCEEKYVKLVLEMLLFWSRDRRSYGLPVGSDASRILSEAVLLNVDEKLKESGLVFIRYVDDFRIFTDTRAEAYKAIEDLTVLLADEGLSLNSRKTEIIKIEDPEEGLKLANDLVGVEHEKIDLAKREEVRRAVSGRSTVSRHYREPGGEAINKLKNISKKEIIKDFDVALDHDVERQIKLIVKYFVYVDQDVHLLELLISRRATAIFYIVDALIKEAAHFTADKRNKIVDCVHNVMDWLNCAYPLQVPVLRLFSSPHFREPEFVQTIINRQGRSDSEIFYREALSFGYPCLDRPSVRALAMNTFGNASPFVRRVIYHAVKEHEKLGEGEMRPLLKNMRQHSDDWFIRMLDTS